MKMMLFLKLNFILFLNVSLFGMDSEECKINVLISDVCVSNLGSASPHAKALKEIKQRIQACVELKVLSNDFDFLKRYLMSNDEYLAKSYWMPIFDFLEEREPVAPFYVERVQENIYALFELGFFHSNKDISNMASMKAMEFINSVCFTLNTRTYCGLTLLERLVLSPCCARNALNCYLIACMYVACSIESFRAKAENIIMICRPFLPG